MTQHVNLQEMAQEESAPKASDEKEERKRKHQQVEEEAEAEQVSCARLSSLMSGCNTGLQEMVEEELKRIKAAKKVGQPRLDLWKFPKHTPCGMLG